MDEAIRKLLLMQKIEQFYYHEADLLDSGRYQEWLDLFADDVRYHVPLTESIQRRTGENVDEEESLVIPLMDDNKERLRHRVNRLSTGLAHSERPPSRMRHFVSNVFLKSWEPNDVVVFSNVLVLRSRLHEPAHSYFGKREDHLRLGETMPSIYKRTIYLDQALLPTPLSVFM